jgi:hypothetical protein
MGGEEAKFAEVFSSYPADRIEDEVSPGRGLGDGGWIDCVREEVGAGFGNSGFF